MYKNKIIFVAPLDWGFGHATRCVPLIKQLMQQNTIILGVTPVTSIIFDEEFPALKRISIEPYNISYSKVLPITLKLLLDAPRILRVIKREQQQLQDIIKTHAIDVVISDNRFGLYTKEIESVYMTHQLNIQAGWLSGIANKIHHFYIKKFSKTLVPDYADLKNSLAGNLSKQPQLANTTYIGPLSRLSKDYTVQESFDYLLLLSGPEPARTVLEQVFVSLVEKSTKKCVLVRGTHAPLLHTILPNLKIMDVATAQQLSQLIISSKTVICRSGYSTLMDLHTLNKTSIVLIPTPGQAEQIYLANYWQEQKMAHVVLQKELTQFTLT